jgi:AraC-like DNA-binding protein
MSDHVRDEEAIGSWALIPGLCGPGDQVTGGLPWSRLRRVVSYVQENLAGELRLAELSALVHMSPYHFARLFRKSTGVPPRQFVIRRRIEAAQTLLAEQQAPIGEVAVAVGFRSQSHFTNSFRRVTGVTPSRFRVAVQVDDPFSASGNESEPSALPGVDRGLASWPAGAMAASTPTGTPRRFGTRPGWAPGAPGSTDWSIGILPKGVPDRSGAAGQVIESAKGGLG